MEVNGYIGYIRGIRTYKHMYVVPSLTYQVFYGIVLEKVYRKCYKASTAL